MTTAFRLPSEYLAPTHRKQIGIAIWELMWCIANANKKFPDPESQGYRVLVLDGEPFKIQQIAQQFGCPPQTVWKNLQRLARGGYIRLCGFPEQLVIEVIGCDRQIA